jgi:hypothetical protein
MYRIMDGLQQQIAESLSRDSLAGTDGAAFAHGWGILLAPAQPDNSLSERQRKQRNPK